MPKSFFTVLILAVIALAIFFGLLNYESIPNKNDGKVSVVAALFPYYDFARIIGGDKAEVFLLLPPGVEAHSFDPKPSDIFKINSADIFVYTGDFMEPWAKDILTGINNKKLSVVKAGDIVSLNASLTNDGLNVLQSVSGSFEVSGMGYTNSLALDPLSLFFQNVPLCKSDY